MASNVDFQQAFADFVAELREYCVMQYSRNVRVSTQDYNHKRCLEVGIWFMRGDQEFGHCFLARTMEWDGRVDWDRLKLILNTEDLAIGPFEETKVWNLTMLHKQQAPQERCTNCGLLK